MGDSATCKSIFLNGFEQQEHSVRVFIGLYAVHKTLSRLQPWLWITLPKPIAILAVSCPPYLVVKAAVLLWCLDSVLRRQGITWESQMPAFTSVL